jgi:DNA-binding NtrC family response regulator
LLFVDDEESILFALHDYFAPEGYDVDEAHDVEQAEALLAKQSYDVVIIDLRLGPYKELLGLELVSRVREHHPTTAVVLYTAHGTLEVATEARRLGAAFLEKPFALPDLHLVIERLRSSINASNSINCDSYGQTTVL